MAAVDPTSIRVGVVGGGQLGQMMALAAHRLGLQLTCLDPAGLASPAGKARPLNRQAAPDPPLHCGMACARCRRPAPTHTSGAVAHNHTAPRSLASRPACQQPSDAPAQVCGSAVTGSLTDSASIKELAAQVDVLTVEIEHIDTAALAAIEAEGRVAVHPSPRTLAIIQDKLLQKQHLAGVQGVNGRQAFVWGGRSSGRAALRGERGPALGVRRVYCLGAWVRGGARVCAPPRYLPQSSRPPPPTGMWLRRDAG